MVTYFKCADVTTANSFFSTHNTHSIALRRVT
jgi:hypothetical protein